MSFIGPVIPGTGGVVDLKIVVVNKTANAQLAANELEKVIEYTNGASNFDFEFPLEATVSIPIGSWGQIRKTGVGNISLIPETAGVSFRGHSLITASGMKIDGEDGFVVGYQKTAVNTWLFTGNIKAF